MPGIKPFLVDGTYELFRHFFGAPSHVNGAGEEVGAVRATVSSMLGMLEGGATHIGVATDQVIESFRNDMWPGYKTGAGVAPELLTQFPLLEDALADLGFTVWPMVEFEADDALAAAAAIAAADPDVEVAAICSPDKDMAQCVVDGRVVQFDRRKNYAFDEGRVIERLGVPPASVPDYLALVGDSADGFPGLKGWGARSTAAVLTKFRHLEDIPTDVTEWGVDVRGAGTLAATLNAERDLAFLFRDLATLRTEVPLGTTVADWRWRGPIGDVTRWAKRFDTPQLTERVARLTSSVGS